MIDTTSHSEQYFSVSPRVREKIFPLSPNSANPVEFRDTGESCTQLDLTDPSFDLVRHFVNQLAEAKEAGPFRDLHTSPPLLVNWNVIRTATANSCSVEQVIGRAVVLADAMCRGAWEGPITREANLGHTRQSPFSLPQ